PDRAGLIVEVPGAHPEERCPVGGGQDRRKDHPPEPIGFDRLDQPPELLRPDVHAPSIIFSGEPTPKALHPALGLEDTQLVDPEPANGTVQPSTNRIRPLPRLDRLRVEPGDIAWRLLTRRRRALTEPGQPSTRRGEREELVEARTRAGIPAVRPVRLDRVHQARVLMPPHELVEEMLPALPCDPCGPERIPALEDPLDHFRALERDLPQPRLDLFRLPARREARRPGPHAAESRERDPHPERLSGPLLPPEDHQATSSRGGAFRPRRS